MKKMRIIALILALAMCLGVMMSAVAFDAKDGQAKAEILSTLGLFKGTDNGFELDRAPTRLEALIMLIRMTGMENEALYGEWEHPFTDAPSWEGANEYLGYAYENGLANGNSATTFDPNSTATAQVYTTFVLRALGYKDAPEGTVYNNWDRFGRSANLFDNVNTDSFKRGDAAVMSYNALNAKVLDTNKKLSDVLLDKGVYNELTWTRSEILAGKKVTADSKLIDIAAHIYSNTELYTNALMVSEINDDNLSYFLGVDKLDYKEAIAVEPLMSSKAHSVCVIRMKNETAAIGAVKDIREKVDPRKWVCVGVEEDHVHTDRIGNLVVLVMDNDSDTALLNNFKKLK